jgi:arabinose-5-phosphate isomerase
VQLALGDALAVALLQRKGFARDDFARLHPGGALGKKLLLRVRDVMESEPAAVLAPSATVQDAIVPLARRRGIVVIAEADQVIRGVFTAGDLTRVLGAGAEGLSRRLGDVMTAGGKRAAPEELASGVVYRMEQGKIVAMPVVDSAGLVVGVVHLHDLLRAGAA